MSTLPRWIEHIKQNGGSQSHDEELAFSPVADLPSHQRMGSDAHWAVNVGVFTEGQRRYLDFHRNLVLLRAVR